MVQIRPFRDPKVHRVPTAKTAPIPLFQDLRVHKVNRDRPEQTRPFLAPRGIRDHPVRTPLSPDLLVPKGHLEQIPQSLGQLDHKVPQERTLQSLVHRESGVPQGPIPQFLVPRVLLALTVLPPPLSKTQRPPIPVLVRYGLTQTQLR